jgi:hypothetical protein
VSGEEKRDELWWGRTLERAHSRAVAAELAAERLRDELRAVVRSAQSECAALAVMAGGASEAGAALYQARIEALARIGREVSRVAELPAAELRSPICTACRAKAAPLPFEPSEPADNVVPLRRRSVGAGSFPDACVNGRCDVGAVRTYANLLAREHGGEGGHALGVLLETNGLDTLGLLDAMRALATRLMWHSLHVLVDAAEGY